jgi:uncharacterized protein YndB with AHSA1/START domain
MESTYQVFIIVNRPRHDVFEAVADPAKLSAYFTTGGASGRLDRPGTVTWDFADFPGPFPVEVREAVSDERIAFSWKANEPGADYQLAVTVSFSDAGEGRTKVEISESGWRSTPAAIKASYGNCMGWSQMLAALKAWAEHGINLRAGAYR